MTTTGIRAAIVLVLLLLATARPAAAQEVSVPDGFVLEPVVSGLSAAVEFTFLPDGRIFLIEKSGYVRVVQDGQLIAEPFLDISDRVNHMGDRGLVGLAVHPRFPDVPYVYLAYAYDPPELRGRSGDEGPDGVGTRVSQLIRVSADPAHDHNRALPGSEVILLGRNSTLENMGDPAVRNPTEPSCGPVGAYVQDCLPADEHSHTIGRVRFGPDGALYVGSGDGADYHGPQPYHVRALDLDSLAGKLLRIDPITGYGLPDNPFYDGDPTSNRSKVLNYGLRNPYSFSFHPITWEPIIGNVGWATWEEIDIGRGMNSGWPCFEGGDQGNLRQPSFADMQACQALYAEPEGTVTAPAYAFLREGVGSAIIAGDVYTGGVYPAEYEGRLFIADYYQRWIRTVPLYEDGTAGPAEDFAIVNYPVQVGLGPDGHMYYIDIWSGSLQRIRYLDAPDNRAPTAHIRASATAGIGPLVVNFDGRASNDPEGSALTYAWHVDDKLLSVDPTFRTYFFRGEDTVKLTVTDEAGATHEASVVIRTGARAPTPTIDLPDASAGYVIGDVITFAGHAVDAGGAFIDEANLHWTLYVHQDGAVAANGLPPEASGGHGTIFAADRGPGAVLELCLTATDLSGASATTCREIPPVD